MKKIFILFLFIYFIGFVIQGSFGDLIEGASVFDKIGDGLKDIGHKASGIGDEIGDEAKSTPWINNNFLEVNKVDVQNLDLDPNLGTKWYEYNGNAWKGYKSGVIAGQFESQVSLGELSAEQITTLESLRNDMGIHFIETKIDHEGLETEGIFYQYEINIKTNKDGAFYFYIMDSWGDATDLKLTIWSQDNDKEHTLDYGSENNPKLKKIERHAGGSAASIL